jgi:hypothetical protein
VSLPLFRDTAHVSRLSSCWHLLTTPLHSKEQALKGKLMLQHSIGLGAQPNVVPSGPAEINGPLRTVQVGWHPVAGLGGKWFAEQTGLGKYITKEINHYPAVLVGDYVHQLWMDESLNIIYINAKLVPSEWHTFYVGKTRFNDQAMREASEMTIHQMREARPAYNLISNNCQNFALNLLNAISVGGHRQFATSFAVYQKATGMGNIKDLFKDDHPEEAQEQHDQGLDEQGAQEQAEDEQGRPPKLQHTNTMQTAQQVMDEHTTKVDKHHHGLGR